MRTRATSNKENAAAMSASMSTPATTTSLNPAGMSSKPRIGGMGRPKRPQASKYHGSGIKAKPWRKPSVRKAKIKANVARVKKAQQDQRGAGMDVERDVKREVGVGSNSAEQVADGKRQAAPTSAHPPTPSFASIPSGILSHHSSSRPRPRSSPYTRPEGHSHAHSLRAPRIRRPETYIHPIAQYPFAGIPFSPSEQAHYAKLLKEAQDDPDCIQIPTDVYETPEALYAGNPQVEQQAQRYRNYLDLWRAGTHGLNPPISVPILEKFTSLFPAIPAKIFEGPDGTVVYPFHVISTKLVVPNIPPVAHTMENGTRLPVDFVLRRMTDHLPLLWQMKELYTLAPANMQKPPSRINTPQYPFGTRIDDTHDELVFWNKEANEHGGLNENGQRLVDVRGPNAVLVVREEGDEASEGMIVPILKTVMSLQCTHFTRLTNQGRSMRSRGDANGQYGADDLARRQRAADLLVERARALEARSDHAQAQAAARAGLSSRPGNAVGSRPGAMSNLGGQPRLGMAPAGVSRATVNHPSPTASTPSNADQTASMLPPPRRLNIAEPANSPRGERIDVRRAPPGANNLHIIPTPPITIRHSGTSPSSIRHQPRVFAGRPRLPTVGGVDDAEDEGDVESVSGEAHSEADTEGVYSVHTTSDIGSVSAMTSESGTSCTDSTFSSRLASYGQGQAGEDEDESGSGSETEVPSEGSFRTSVPSLRARIEDAHTSLDSQQPHLEPSHISRVASAAFFPRSISLSAPHSQISSAPTATARPATNGLYNSPTPLIGQTRIVPGNMRQTYGIKTLPILSLLIPDLASFPALLRHLHHPRESLLPALAGFDPLREPINSTAQLQVRLYALSAYELLVRAEAFRRFVANLTALGIGAKATWTQVEIVHAAFIRVLSYRGGIVNAELGKMAVPLIERPRAGDGDGGEGEKLPGVVFSKYDEGMLERHSRWAALRRVKAEEFGIVPVGAPGEM